MQCIIYRKAIILYVYDGVITLKMFLNAFCDKTLQVKLKVKPKKKAI